MAVWQRRVINRVIQAVLLLVLVATTHWIVKQSPPHASDIIDTPSSDSALPTGWPVVTQQDANHSIQFLHNQCYDVGYSNARANPLWVTYRLSAQQDGQVDKRQPKFITDTRTDAKIVHEHYNRSGYDRGHLAPNHAIAVMCDDEAQKETFLMTNIVPQAKALNQRWWERLERAELNFFTHTFKEVWVIDGPVFGANPVQLPNGPVQVPEACYKVLVAQQSDQWHVLAFLVDQGVKGDEPLSKYRVSVAQIEQRIGFDLLPNLPDDIKSKLKRDNTDTRWNLTDVDHLPTRF